MLDNLQECNNWQCINSFALWISAIGTVSVSAIALWLSIRDRFIKVRAAFDTALIPGADPTVLDRSVYILSFTNVGPRPVTITNYAWKIPFSGKSKFMITFPQMDASINHLCTKFPVELTDGQSGNLVHVKGFFRDMDAPETFMYPKQAIIAWFRIWFFRIYINTSIGKNVKVKVQKRVRKALWAEYKRLNA